jgi:hypothetical protein
MPDTDSLRVGAKPMTFFLFILAALATYRLALMFSKESGPGKIFMKLRKAPPPRSSAREGLSCPFCMSIWFGVVITAVYVAVCFNQRFTRGNLK